MADLDFANDICFQALKLNYVIYLLAILLKKYVSQCKKHETIKAILNVASTSMLRLLKNSSSIDSFIQPDHL